MADQLGVGVIGCGGISAAHLPAQTAIEGMRTMAVCDLNQDAARAAADKYDVPAVYAEYADLLADESVDAVAILLPHHLHRDCAVAAAAAGKHILCEKPMATSLQDVDDMITAADEAGVVLMIGQILRFRPANIRARELVLGGAIGEVKNIMRRRYGKSQDFRSDWASDPAKAGGWVLYGFGTHEVDMILWLTDAEPEQVYANARKNNEWWHDYDELGIELGLSNGAMASYHHSTNCPFGAWDCILVGSEGAMLVESERIRLNGEVIEAPLDGPASHVAQSSEFLRAVREGDEPEASGRSVRPTMVALEAAKISIAEGRVVDASKL
jgi:predicted dehydrogenase